MADKEMEELLRSWGFEPGPKAINMTLRDWFAGQALAAVIQANYRSGYVAETATEAYQFADEMMRRHDDEYMPAPPEEKVVLSDEVAEKGRATRKLLDYWKDRRQAKQAEL